jgi:hypothetical protein
MTALPRLRQVALVAHDRVPVEKALQDAFGWRDPFRDPGVGEFGLDNAVFAAGECFIEVVAPVRADTTAGRYLNRRGGDSGYMAIFQVADAAAARRRVAGAGIRVVWQADLPDIAGTHLHPKDVPGAIVSLDWAEPAESWRWAGPDWTGHAPPHPPGGISGLVVEAEQPAAAAGRWAAALGVKARSHGDDALIELTEADQLLRFTHATSGRGDGIIEVSIRAAASGDAVIPLRTEICGVRFVAEAL